MSRARIDPVRRGGRLLVLLLAGALGGAGSAQMPATRLLEATVAAARSSSVVGREGMAAEHVLALLGDLGASTDALGNVTLVVGSGAPRRLLAVPLDEPGYVISGVDDGGYLRLTPVGQPYRGALAHQAIEGNEVSVVTRAGIVPGAVGVPSTHLTSFAREPVSAWPPFAWQDAYVDVGAGSRGEVAALGIDLMDTMTLIKRPVVLRGGSIAAPSVQTKAALVALAEAAQRLAAHPGAGTTVLAWTTLGLLNGKGLETVVHGQGPFDEVYLFSRDFGWGREGRSFLPVPTAPLGAGVLSADGVGGTVQAEHLDMSRHPTTNGPEWGDARVRQIGLPTRYQDTPVETVAAVDIAALADFFTAAANPEAPPQTLPAASPVAAGEPDERPFAELATTLGSLVARYGVSGNEAAVRDEIRAQLPDWARPQVDDAGNLSITFGQGEEHVLFVAHMDETGYRVTEIRDDGTLVLGSEGGMLAWLWEAQAALVHTAAGAVPAVFEPRTGRLNARARRSDEALTASVGASDRSEVERSGIAVGDTVTMPKAMRRVGWYRAMARAFDDRAGSAALVAAAQRIHPASLRRRVTFAWSTREETGLIGAQALARQFPDVTVVHPVDTFVSSDAPLESKATALAPLGSGFVLRVVESINYVPSGWVRRVRRLAGEAGIPIQLGMTSGGTDGQPWVARGVPSVPLSWPGRYSHSPIEILDLRDLDALVRMIETLVTRPLDDVEPGL